MRVVTVVLRTVLTPESPVMWNDTNTLVVALPSLSMIALSVWSGFLDSSRWWWLGNAFLCTSEAWETVTGCVMVIVALADPVLPELSVTVSVTLKVPVDV